MEPKEFWKVALFGDGAVGKTAIAWRLTKNNFLETYDPTIEDSYRKTLTVQGERAVVEVMDTAGQEEYHTLRDQWLSQADAIGLVYSVTSRKSFNNIVNMNQALLGVGYRSGRSYPVIVVVANKIDVDPESGEWEVTIEEGQRLARYFGGQFLEVSAKSGYNVLKLFELCVIGLRARRDGKLTSPLPNRGAGKTAGGSSIAPSPSAFSLPNTPNPTSIGHLDVPIPRARQGSVPTLRSSVSAYPLPRSSSGHENNAGGSASRAFHILRPRNSTSALQSPVDDTPPPPVPHLPANTRSMEGSGSLAGARGPSSSVSGNAAPVRIRRGKDQEKKEGMFTKMLSRFKRGD